MRGGRGEAGMFDRGEFEYKFLLILQQYFFRILILLKILYIQQKILGSGLKNLKISIYVLKSETRKHVL